MKRILSILLLVFFLLTLTQSYDVRSGDEIYSENLSSINSTGNSLLFSPIKSSGCEECSTIHFADLVVSNNLVGEFNCYKSFPSYKFPKTIVLEYVIQPTFKDGIFLVNEILGITTPLFIQQQSFLI
jgi:hypothetical protein